MTARDRWEVELQCPICGNAGSAELSEENGPDRDGKHSPRVDYTPPKFDYEFNEEGRPHFFCKEHRLPE